MYKNQKSFLKNRYDPINNRTIYYQKDSRIKALVSVIKKTKEPIKLLDIGCYDGHIGLLLKKQFGKNCEIFGIDTATNSIMLARQKGIEAKVCNVADGISFEADMFDYVFAGEIIEHLYDTDFFMREVKRILKPDGILILTTPNFLSLGRRIFYLFGKGIYMEQSLSLPKNAAGHIRYFTFETLKEFVMLHSFEPIMSFSDVISFTHSGFGNTMLAKIFPTLGRSIISFLRNKK